MAVPLTEWLRGISVQKLKEIEQRSDLAAKYLEKITHKDTTDRDKITYYSGLSRLEGHPLQSWAQDQLAKQEERLRDYNAILAKAQKTIEEGDERQAELANNQAQLAMLKARILGSDRTESVEA